MTFDCHQEEVTTLVRGCRLTRTDATANYSVPSIVSSITGTPTVVQNQAQRSLQDWPHELQGGPAAAMSSRSSRLPAASGTRRNAMGRYLCVCGKSYSQPQGLRRHQRERHEVSSCLYCGVFEWSRRYRLREHLMKQHPDVDIEAALADVTRTRRRAIGGTSHRGV
jgi:hypothetical protein